MSEREAALIASRPSQPERGDWGCLCSGHDLREYANGVGALSVRWMSRHDGRQTGRPGATTPGLHPIRTTIRWERRRREWFGGVSERAWFEARGRGLSLGFFFGGPAY